jgi:hemerythrin
MPAWTPSLAVGHPTIDAQHQELFRRVDELLAAMSSGKPAEEVGRCLQFVDDYCSEHFSAEERLMREKRYPGLAAHVAAHGVFVKDFQVVAESFRAKGPAVSVTIALQRLVSGWLVSHIGSEDRKLAAFLAAGGERRTA